ncbi:hypothetical protein FISHEDRAFT_71652 [Fistulina hepatica ATCC 64428]|uniref:Copper transporter n=1 Tax=Fistulina hepatica ATCC 64428 TaxID=1128425 RepID=A0A0D7AHH0_9AGAR|nr:hypothetical protein FISHEDRAFT_71652 [Fistulina hepatica ATCC 64428]
MADSSFADFFHWTATGHVLFESLSLDGGFPVYLAALVLIFVICASERIATHILSKNLVPAFAERSRIKSALWRACIFWIATLMRLSYMLIAMSFHVGLILLVVTTLASSQFFIELWDSRNSTSPRRFGDPYFYEERCGLLDELPLTKSTSSTKSFSNVMPSRTRTKSKPGDIFIHPAHSNLARADAAALELGLAGCTERVHAVQYDKEEAPWVEGEGRDAAHALLGLPVRRSES